MTISGALAKGEANLKRVGIGTARLDALVLLEDCTGINRAKLLAEPNKVLNDESINAYLKQIKARSTLMPLAYVRHKSEFYGREFYIDERVLEPRPESEAMIEELLKLIKKGRIEPRELTIVDVGTGSGALAVTAALEVIPKQSIGIDISADCLKVAEINAKKYQVPLLLEQGDLLAPLDENFKGLAICLANLPYVPDFWQINPAALREPRLAIFGGKDGLRIYGRFFSQLQRHPFIQYVMTESMPPQHEELRQIANKNNFTEVSLNDFVQVFSR